MFEMIFCARVKQPIAIYQHLISQGMAYKCVKGITTDLNPEAFLSQLY